MIDTEKLYSCEQIAEHYGVNITTVWKWIRTNRLKAKKIGKMYRITEEAIEQFEDATGKQRKEDNHD